MKLKKFVLIIILLIFLTGCTAEYNIEINDDKIYEDINIKITPTEENRQSLSNYLANGIVAFYDSGHAYKYKLTEIDNGLNLKFEYGNLIGYSFSSFFKQCFEKSSISSDEKNIYIKASGFICRSYDYVDVEDAVINFKTNHEVQTHNADIVSNGIYKWYPLKNDKGVTLILNIKNDSLSDIEKDPIIEEEELFEEEQEQKEETPIIIIIMMFMAFILSLIVVIMLRMNKQRR